MTENIYGSGHDQHQNVVFNHVVIPVLVKQGIRGFVSTQENQKCYSQPAKPGQFTFRWFKSPFSSPSSSQKMTPALVVELSVTSCHFQHYPHLHVHL